MATRQESIVIYVQGESMPYHAAVYVSVAFVDTRIQFDVGFACKNYEKKMNRVQQANDF